MITRWTPGVITKPIYGGFRPAAFGTAKLAKALAPRRAGGGRHKVRESVRIKFVGRSSAQISAFPPVAGGSAPHEIAPRNKQALFSSAYGHPVSKAIDHPGNRANPFLVKAQTAFPALYAAEVRRRMR